MKRLQSLSYKTLFTILFLSLAGIVFFIRIGGKTQKVSAAWWDEMWHYRKAIQINNSGTNRTNIQFKLFTNYDLSSLVSAGKIQADLDDLRFTDINGNLLNYWIEDPTNNSADIWIVLNSLPNSGTTVYLYYGNSSATSGQTIMGKTPNNPGISCKAIQLSGGSDGVYYIDPTGLEATDAYQTYCDMSGNGGGWTLLMKSEGNTTTFNYNANYWTTTNTLNPNDADINQNTDAKFESFNSLLIDQIRATWPSTGHTMVETISTTTALGLFQTTVDLGPSMAQFDYTNFPYQTGYQSYGFNLTCAAANKVRWGWMFNNETTCSSNDCSAGIGLMTVYSTTNGGYVTCCSSKPNGGYPYRVRIWGRENNIVTPNVSFINTTPQSEESSTGPIAYWKFDEGTGTTAYDSSSNNNDGTFLSNPIWKNEDECITGKCLSFDNVDDGVSVNNNFTNLNDYSMCAWINPKGNHKNYTGTIISSGDWNTNHWAFGINQSNTAIQTRRADGVNFFTWNYNFSINQWSYVCITRSNTIINAYVNGKQTGSTYTGTTGNVISNAANTTIGRETYAGGYFAFNGLIDEPKIYPYARTADQIKQDYNSRGSLSGAGVNLGVNSNTAPSLKSSLIAHYKFDEGSGVTAYDSSGNNKNATITESTWSNSGKFNKAISLGSTNAIITSNAIYNNSQTFTLSAHIYPTETSGDFKTVIGTSYGNNANSALVIRNNNICFHDYYTGSVDTNICTTNNPIILNQWQYISLTYDNGTINFYYNGGKNSNGNFTKSNTTGAVIIGRGTNYTGSRNFLGLIDEVKIYNRALTPEEVKQDYNAGSAIQFGSTSQSIGGTTTSLEYCIPGDTAYCAPPIAEWNMDEGVGTSIVDTSSNNYTSTFIGTPTWNQGKIGKSITFNGSNNAIQLSGPATSPHETLSSWVYIDSSSPNGDIVGNCHTNANQHYGFTLYLDGNNLRTKAATNADTYFFDNVYYDISSFKDKWIHLSMVWDNLGTGTGGCDTNVKLLINGQIVDEATHNVSSGSYNCTYPYPYPFSMGGTTVNSLTRTTKVKLDQVRVYNYARTPAQIAYDYNKGGPVGWWKFDECQGSTAYDWSGNQNNGTITIGASGSQNSLGTCAIGTSAAWTNGSSGKTNSSLNFDGTDDYINAGNQSSLNLTNNLTLAAWVNSKLWTSGEGYPRIIAKGNSAGVGYQLMSYMGGSLLVELQGTTSGSFSVPYSFSTNKWYHVVATYNGAKIVLYVNGNMIGSTNATGNITTNSYNLEIGRRGDNARYFNGQIDDVRIYNYALTSEQIKQIYNGGAVNFR